MRSAIHICVGDRTAEDAVNDWLQEGGATVVDLGDAYAATTYLIRHRDQPPCICAVGAHWLRTDEMVLLTYIRRTWPRTPLVVYGLPPGERLPDDAGHAIVCRSPAELQSLLSEPLESLLGSAGSRDEEQEDDEDEPTLMRSGNGRAPREAPAARDSARPQGEARSTAQGAAATPREALEALVADEPRDSAGVYAARPVSVATSASPSPREWVSASAAQREIDDPILTREELAALLGEDE